MPNGYEPASQDDKDWKIAVERQLAEYARLFRSMQNQIDALSQRK